MRCLSGLAALCLTLAALPAAAETSWRVQVTYDPETRSVTRQRVGIVDPLPGQALEFRWEPAPGNWPGIDADGMAEGPGVLTFRAPGTAAYDPRAVLARYRGGLAAGAFDGKGVWLLHDGTRHEGTFRDGLLQGEGHLRTADGALYDGAFRDGRPEGEGRWRAVDGTLYEGGFRAGLRHGEGRVTLPGGQVYAVTSDRGVETRSTRPAVIADATLKGLLPAQGGGEAGRVQIGVVTDARMAEQQGVIYTHYANGTELQIFPEGDDMIAVWNGNGQIGVPYQFLENLPADWDETRAFLDIDLATTDGSKVRLEKLQLVVDYSQPNLRPMLDAQAHYGCTGFRPDLDLTNFGYAPVRNPTLQVRFVHPESFDYEHPADSAGTGWYDLPVAGFDDGTDIDLRPALDTAGMDTRTLSSNRFTCPSQDMVEQCAANLFASVDFGDLAGVVTGGDSISTQVVGRLSYDWTDAAGADQKATEDFTAMISLVRIEMPAGMAEMGDGGAYFTASPNFVDIELPSSGQSYAVDIPVRGNPNVARLQSQIKLWSRETALHSMRVEATFSDGSVRASPQLYLFFYNPRDPEFTSTMRPAACFLSDY